MFIRILLWDDVIQQTACLVLSQLEISLVAVDFFSILRINPWVVSGCRAGVGGVWGEAWRQGAKGRRVKLGKVVKGNTCDISAKKSGVVERWLTVEEERLPFCRILVFTVLYSGGLSLHKTVEDLPARTVYPTLKHVISCQTKLHHL
jgi:hypothetical protein